MKNTINDSAHELGEEQREQFFLEFIQCAVGDAIVAK